MHVYNILKYGLFFIVRKIIYILTLLITIFIKRDPNLLVFGAWFGQKYSDNSKYLFEYLVGNHKEYKIVWVTKSDEVIKLITDKH